MQYRWDFSFISNYINLLADGLLLTFAYTIGTVICGLLVGLLIGVLRLSNKYISRTLKVFIELFRCTPALVQLVWMYYALPVIIGINIDAWLAAALALTLYAAAFYSEIFRGGIIAVDSGQWDAARAIGMKKLLVFRRIVLPQAIRIMIPPFLGQTILQVKNTSLISTIAVADLLYQGNIIATVTYRPLEVYTCIAFIYFMILFPITLVSEKIEQVMKSR